jgi:hypothetical protein
MTALFSWLSSWFPNLDRPPCAAIYVLRVPAADDSPPHILLLQTIDNSAADNVDCCFDHIPDLRSFWGSGEGWQRRGLAAAWRHAVYHHPSASQHQRCVPRLEELRHPSTASEPERGQAAGNVVHRPSWRTQSARMAVLRMSMFRRRCWIRACIIVCCSAGRLGNVIRLGECTGQVISCCYISQDHCYLVTL